jgi:hypothetical protein
LLTYALTAAVAFEILSLRSYALPDDGATAGNSLENRFSEHLAVTFSRFV